MLKLALVVPCYNESDSLLVNVPKIQNYINDLMKSKVITDESYILLVDDGSTDDTWFCIKELKFTIQNLQALKFVKNEGHQKALLAGLEHVLNQCDIAVTMDSDLQHDPKYLKEMIKVYLNEKADIVTAVRNSDYQEKFLKKQLSILFYKFIGFIGVNLKANHADYRLLSHAVLETLSQYKESQIFLRGLLPLMGYREREIVYQQKNRELGKSKYNFKKMITLALDGVTSLSVAPLRLIFFIGLLASLISLCGMIYTFYVWFNGQTLRGWSHIIFAIYFLGGTQLLSIGIIGEYVGRIYQETKKRPRYIIAEKLI